MAVGHRSLAGASAPEYVAEELNSACAVVPGPVQLMVEGIVADQPNRPGVVEPDTVQVTNSAQLRPGSTLWRIAKYIFYDNSPGIQWILLILVPNRSVEKALDIGINI